MQTSLEIQKQQKKVHAFVAKNPGATAEVIREKVKLTGAEVSYVLRKLRGAGYLKASGSTRAMAYKVTAKALA